MKLRVALIALAVVAAACGAAVGDEPPTTTATTASSTSMEPDSMGGMNMGDPAATSAGQVPGAEVVSGEFRLLPSAPAGFEDLAGSAALARHAAGTTVTIGFSNLVANTEFVAHLHAGTCFDSGGPHYKFDLDGADVPPNEIHLGFASSANGAGNITAENHRVAGPEATSVVVHEMMDGAPKIACADLS